MAWSLASGSPPDPPWNLTRRQRSDSASRAASAAAALLRASRSASPAATAAAASASRPAPARRSPSPAVLALEHDGPAIYNIVDDEPAPMREWLPVLASALGAKPPRHVPRWLARLVGGEDMTLLTEARGASNAKAKRELGWTLRYPSWRQGFAEVYATPTTPRATPI